MIEEINGKARRKEQLFLLFLLFIPCLFINLEFNSDTYWLVNSGRYVLQHGIAHIEPFTLHENLRFVMQQWLSATLFALIYDALGNAFLFLLVAIVYGGILYAVFRLCMRVSENNFLVSFTVAFAVSIPLNFFMVLRPYLFSLTILALEMNLLEAYVRTKKKALLVWLPLLSVLLINLHAAMWPFFFVMMLPYAIDSFRFKLWFVNGEGYERLLPGIAALCSLLIGFVNPYGFESMTYLFRSYGNAYVSSFINEMQSPDFKNAFGIIVFLLYLSVVVVYCVNRKGGTKLRYALLTIGTGFLGLSSIRSLSLFLICGIPFVAYTLRKEQIVKSTSAPKFFWLRYLLMGAIVALLGAFFFVRAARSEKEAQIYLPISAVEYIKTQLDTDDIRLYTGYATGGYAEFEGLRPFMDARAEVFYKSNNGQADIINDYFDMLVGKTHYSELVKKYRLTHFLVEKSDLLAVYLPKDPDYKLLFTDGDFMVFALKQPPV